MVKLLEEDRTHSIIGAFYEVYNTLGYGYLESVYCSALEGELRDLGHTVARQYAVRVMYKGREVGFHRLDLLVDDRVILEIKSTAVLPPTAQRQLLNYLRGTSLEIGLLLHFGPKPVFYRQVCLKHQTDSDQSGSSV